MRKYLATALLFVQLVAPAWAETPPATKPSTCVRPVWPEEAIRNKYEGKVTLAFLVGDGGRVQEARIEQSSGHQILDKAAMIALAGCHFKQPADGDKTGANWLKVQYVWSLEDQRPSNAAAPKPAHDDTDHPSQQEPNSANGATH